MVGDIFSEHDHHRPEPILREPDGSALVQGSVAIREVNRSLGLFLPEGEGWSTIAGLCLKVAGRIPATGEVLEAENGTRLEVVAASPHRVRSVGIHAGPATGGDRR